MDKGIYCLVFRNHGCNLRIGALGAITFRAGWHTYVGSALGSGGLKRLERHISLAHLHNKQPKWHIDHLLTSPLFSLVCAFYAVTAERLECQLARELNDGGVSMFGCSDCSCTSHLLYRPGDPKREILAAFHNLQLDPIIKTIINPQVQDNI